MALELVLRARHSLSLDRLDEAEALARQAAAASGSTSAADALHIIGVVNLRRRRPEAAENALRQALERDGAAAAYHSDLGNALQDRGKLNEAIAAYRRALRLHPGFAEAWNDLGTARYAKGELEAAIECYQQALRLRPDHIVAHANLGAVYRKLGLLSEARRSLQRELGLRLKARVHALWRRRRLNLKNAAQLAKLARAQLECGNPRHAAEIAQHAIGLDVRCAAAHCTLSEARLRQGRPTEALEAARAAAQARPADAAARHQLGRALAATGQAEAAAAAYARALELQPDALDTIAALGKLRLRRGEAAGSERLLRRALELRPHDAGLHVLLGDAHSDQQDRGAAEAAYRRALELAPLDLAAPIRLSELLRATERFDEAVAAAQAAIALDDESASAHTALGMAYKAQGRMKKAIECLERALALKPNHVPTLQQLALALREFDRADEAEQHLRAALRARPDEPILLADLGMLLADQMRYAEALALYDRALARAPQSVITLGRKGLLLEHMGEPAQGLELLRAAVRLGPGDDYAHYNLALHHLKYGEFAQGWEGYERRRNFDSFVNRYRRVPLPEWDDEPLSGRVMLVLPEQGLGDEIMFGSCVPDVAGLAAHAFVECDQKLEAIFRRSFSRCTVVSRQRTLANDWINRLEPRPDLKVAAGSLARRFRRRREDFPQQPFLRADAARIAAWRTRLEALGPGRKIGLSWRGGIGFTGKTRRSFSLEQLLPVLRLPGVQFVSLQYTDAREEMRALEQAHAVRLHHWQEAIDDYDQTAALVCALDGVLTVCTAIVHLTGALGRPALVMVPFGADWRYGAAGERMVWYPSVRLLRQRAVGQWDDVLAEVIKRLGSGDWP